MKLCIPFEKSDKTYTDFDVKKPRSGDIADVQEAFTDQTEFHGILKLLSAGISQLEDSDGGIVADKQEIESICRYMPYQTAEQVALQIMILLNGTDNIETETICPRCGKSSYTDNAISMSELKTTVMDGVATITLDVDPVFIKAKNGEVLKEVNIFSMRYPNINDCISASMKIPPNKSARRQYEIYANAILTVNDEEVDMQWKKTWGRYILEKMEFEVLSEIGQKMQEYGIQKTIDMVCSSCGREWKAPISTTDFFESGLHGM